MARNNRGLWFIGVCTGLSLAVPAAAQDNPAAAPAAAQDNPAAAPAAAQDNPLPSDSPWDRIVYPPKTGFLGIAAKSTVLSSSGGARFGLAVGLADEWFFPANFSGRAELTYQYFWSPMNRGAVSGFHSASLMLLPRYYLGTSPGYLEIGGGAVFLHEKGDGTTMDVAFHGSGAVGLRFSHLDVSIVGGVIDTDAFVALRLVEPGVRLR